MIRLFVGLALPDSLADPLAALAVGMPGARWVDRRNLHVTLRFIGEIEDGLAREVHEELATLTEPRLSLSVRGFGTFGSRQPRALYAAVEKTPELLRLQTKVETTLTRLGLPPEPRKFTPHITLAWLKGTPTGRIQDFISGNSTLVMGPMEVGDFTLFRSHLGRSGADYEALADYPLE